MDYILTFSRLSSGLVQVPDQLQEGILHGTQITYFRQLPKSLYATY